MIKARITYIQDETMRGSLSWLDLVDLLNAGPRTAGYVAVALYPDLWA